MNDASAGLGPPERLHPFFLLTGLGGSLRGLAGGYAGLGYLAATGRLELALMGMVALLAFMAAGLFLYWRRFEFRVGTHEVRIDSGILSRTHRSIPFDRVQDVDITQGPVARLLGLAKLKFETGGSAGAANEDGILHCIALGRAEQIRGLVRGRQADAAADRTVAEEPRDIVYAMDGRRLLLAGLFNFSLAVLGGLFGLTQTMGDVIGFDPLSRDFWRGQLRLGEPVTEFIAAHGAIATAAGLLVLVVIGIASGIVQVVLRDYRFTLDRTRTGLRRRRGLLTLTDVTLPARRTQAAVILTGPVRDRFGWRELRLQSLAREEGGKADHVVAPLASDREVSTILSGIGWEPPGEADWQPVSRAYVLAFATALSPLLLPALILLPFAPLQGLAILLALTVAVGTRWLAWRRYAFALDGDRLLVRSGWWRRRTRILPLRNVQSVDFVQLFVDRWFGTAGLVVGVAGGGMAGHGIKALPTETAREVRRRLLSRYE